MKRTTKLNKTVSMMIAIAMVMVLVPSTAKASDVSNGTVQIGNILGNAVTTLVRGLVQGKVKNLGDALKMMAYGGAAGYGFYQSKRLVANGSVTTGVMLANLSASVSENVSWGQNPLAYIGYTIGFARIRVATPLAKNPAGIINVDISGRDLVNTVMALKYSNGFSFRGGLLSFTADESYKGNALGWTFGPYATTLNGAADHVFAHEAVHVIQNLQLSAASPYEPFLKDRRSRKSKIFNFSGLRLDTLSVLNDLTMASQDYNDQWKEIEAFHFSGK